MMDDLGFSLKNLFGKKKKKSAPEPVNPAPTFTVPLPKDAKAVLKPSPALAPMSSGWQEYIPLAIGGGIVLVGLFIIIRMRKAGNL